ncbi:hypothetical protein WMO40_01160 [Bacillaceae bacterium CLA-AA-H227]|uniref:Uncharacterized protein n=1 Tax=Robertmurraya yapensis (ex Hitch et al 2024) TaxID=3133160 RepID=A0ACC6S5R6_9BACI|nr:hypothetical protein [Bacillus yapensis]
MPVQMTSKDAGKKQAKSTSRHGNVPPRNPNKRPTTINMNRSIGRMKANDRDAIRRAQ